MFASVDDLEKRWRSLDATEEEKAEVLIQDASAYILALLEAAGLSVEPENETQAQNLKAVTCAVVRRAMSPNDLFGVSQTSKTAGQFSESFSFANPNGDMYLTAAEKALLGIPSRKRAAMRFVRPEIHGGSAHDW